MDDGFKAFEAADKVGAVGPWTAEVDVKGITVFFGREFGVGIFGDEVSECTGFTPELTILVCVLEEIGLERELGLKLGNRVGHGPFLAS